MEVFCLDCGGGYTVYTFITTHLPEVLKWVNFVAYKLYTSVMLTFKKQGGKKEALAQRSFF